MNDRAGSVLNDLQHLVQESTSLAAGGNRSITYEWDGNGNLAAKTEAARITLYRFDPQNRLIDIRTGTTRAEAQAANPSVSYGYDSAGNRIRKGGSQAGSYLIDASQEYAQVALEADNRQSTSYTRGLQLVRQNTVAGLVTYDLNPLHGYLGTSLGAADAVGNVAEQIEGDAFGNFDQLINAKQAHLYAGEYWDQDSQLLYLRARWYDPRVGRFISADPFEGKQVEPRSLSRYVYVNNDPAHVVDPGGKFGFVSVSLGGLAQTSFRGISVGGAASFVAKTGAEIAFEMATGIPVITSPRSLISAVRSGANVTGNLATKFWLNMFKAGSNFEKEGLKFLSRLGYTKNTKRFVEGEVTSAKSGYFIPDVYIKGSKLLDFKTSFGAVSKEQFQQFIKIANQELGLKVSLVMLKKPTAGEIAIMEKWAKEVTTKTGDKDILFSIIHLLD